MTIHSDLNHLQVALTHRKREPKYIGEGDRDKTKRKKHTQVFWPSAPPPLPLIFYLTPLWAISSSAVLLFLILRLTPLLLPLPSPPPPHYYYYCLISLLLSTTSITYTTTSPLPSFFVPSQSPYPLCLYILAPSTCVSVTCKWSKLD